MGGAGSVEDQVSDFQQALVMVLAPYVGLALGVGAAFLLIRVCAFARDVWSGR